MQFCPLKIATTITSNRFPKANSDKVYPTHKESDGITKSAKCKSLDNKCPANRGGTTTIKGVEYFRTRITGVDGKRVTLYARTSEELAQKVQDAKHEIVEAKFRKENPTVAEYCQKWLLMQSAKVTPATLKGYESKIRNYIVKPLGELYMLDVTCDDIRLALVPASKKSASVYSVVNMLIKCVFYSAERSHIIEDNPTKGISAKGGTPAKGKEALTDTQVKQLLKAVHGLPPQTFVMIGLFAGLRREEILALQWDCVFLDAPTPYISVRRAWRSEHNRPVISRELKTDAAKRDIPIPECLVNRLKEVKAASNSDFVIADSEGNPLSYSQFKRLWQYINVRTWKYSMTVSISASMMMHMERLNVMSSISSSRQKHSSHIVLSSSFSRWATESIM